MIRRLPDWPARLHAAVEAARRTPFAWGGHDCSLFACDIVLAMTGIDLADWFRGRYADEDGARAALAEFAGGGLAETAAKITASHGLPAITWRQAGRGDIALFDGPLFGRLGVCLDHRAVVASQPEGIALLPLRAAQVCWMVPE